MNRQLIIRPGGIGDCLLALPAMEYVAAQADTTEVWVPRPLAPLIQFGARVRALNSTGIDLMGVGDRPADPKLIATLSSFDRVVSWYGENRPDFRALLRAEYHRALPPPEYSGHAADFFSRQVGASVGQWPRITVEAQQRRNSLVIHPFSGGKPKNWPLASFREVAARFERHVEWCAGPEEELPDAARFESLLYLAQWLAGAGCYLGNDSGITHLAAAVGVPVIAIFTATDPAVWAPRGPNVTVLSSPSPLEVSQLLDSLLWDASSERSAFGRP